VEASWRTQLVTREILSVLPFLHRVVRIGNPECIFPEFQKENSFTRMRDYARVEANHPGRDDVAESEGDLVAVLINNGSHNDTSDRS
jgi:hypothetical protein